ncbi:uncharacterized protein si:ch1073-126c3.2 [Dunckerocampus dactyliophorus]|uniref:uncharacterized protein si:ch1073-126c3.2 n=1 Tax=Dunckerocampus dactyliophorus TaxID=161453 RepID=UPI002405C354|nr:uncharacterized protein si:ch1073-126c3.2 [Dunckerocampus dactyliophorus]
MAALKTTAAWLCLLAVLPCSNQDQVPVKNCSSQLLEDLSADLQVALECSVSPSAKWSTQQTAALLLHMRNVTDVLHKHQQSECYGAEPVECPEPEVPKNGGLVCATLANRRYCKPLCNHGYDFAFIRRSRLFDECSEQTGYRWNSQYIGGNALAFCNEASIQVAGGKTAYFPKDNSCLATKTSDHKHSDIIQDFTEELKGLHLEADAQSLCLVCG